jgi:polysaccharide deacetylase family protein (PEP-CTERM system associated)
MMNALSIDVEDYFNVSGFESHIRFEEWGRFERRVEANTDRLLAILGEHRVHATFFVLGWIAERHPTLVKRIHDAGHEIASHSYAHRLIYRQTPAQFREDLKRSKAILEEITGEKILGYRAPSYSIVKESLWALDILAEEGFLYDSSIFPIFHDRYGIPNGERFIYKIAGSQGRSIYEVPLSTVALFGKHLPIAGGGYLRLFPYRFIRWGLTQINQKERQPAIVYLHPWEIDVAQPRMQGSLLSTFRHYVNLHKTESRMVNLLKDFRFGTIRQLLDKHVDPVEQGVA